MPCAVLVADQPRRTSKYLQAVAAHIPCVHYDWVLDCVEQRRVLPLTRYLLKYGTSIKPVRDVVLYAPFLTNICVHLANIIYFFCFCIASDEKEKKIDTVRALEGLHIELEGSATFQAIWIPILQLAGATVVDSLYADSAQKPTAVLLENEPAETDPVVDAARKVIFPRKFA